MARAPHRPSARRPPPGLLPVLAVLVPLSAGCASLPGVSQAVRRALEPQVPGPPPINAEQARELDEDELRARLAFLRDSLEDNRLHATVWYYGFLAVNGGGMAASATLAALERNEHNRLASILDASLAFIGTTYLLARPLPGRDGAASVDALPSATHADRAAQLALAERTLYRAAGRARQRTGWLMHVGNLTLNGAAAGILVSQGALDDAAFLFGTNVAVGTAQILLAPWAPARSWAEYRAMVDDRAAGRRRAAPWHVAPTADGVTVGVRLAF